MMVAPAANGRIVTNGRNATKSAMRAKGPVPTRGLCATLPRVTLDSSVELPLATVIQEPVTHFPHVRLWRQNEHIYAEHGLDMPR